jgi:serine/threonine protein kinase
LGDTYVIECPLGRGGFGITYRGHHKTLYRTVAIKEFFPRDLADRDATTGELLVSSQVLEPFGRTKERFLREGRTLARFHNPNIVQITDIVEANNSAYLIMEYLSGATLKEYLRENGGKLPEDRVLSIAGALVHALTTIHEQQIFHLDIKPDNILVEPDGRIVLIDFGAAKQVSTLDGTQTTTTFAFTPKYAPLELISSQSIGPQTDIFEMGMLLYELLTGTVPPDALTRISRGEELWEPEGVREPFRSALRSALRLNRENRPQTVHAWWETFAPATPKPNRIPAIPPIPVVARPLPKPGMGKLPPLTLAVPLLLAGSLGTLLLVQQAVNSTKGASTTRTNNAVLGSAGVGNSSPTPTPVPPIDPVKSLLASGENAVLSLAKSRAYQGAKSQALKEGVLPKTRLEQITEEALRAEYQKRLTSAQYQQIFGETPPWNYARWNTELPRLTTAVYTSATTGANDGLTARQKAEQAKQAQREKERQAQIARAKRPTPQPSARPPARPSVAPSKRKPAFKPKATPKPKPKATPKPKPRQSDIEKIETILDTIERIEDWRNRPRGDNGNNGRGRGRGRGKPDDDD